MKIAMIGLRGIPAKSGGVEVVVENLAPLLVKQGAKVTVYCRNPYCEGRPETFKGVKLRYQPTINTKYTEAIVHTFLSTIEAMFCDYDIIHYHAMGNGMFSIIPRITGKKTIVTLHGLDWEREKWGTLATAFLKFNEWLISFFPNKVISVSKKIKNHYRKKYDKYVEFIPNGVKIPRSRGISSLKKYWLKKDQYILFLSRVVPEKGIHFLIKAFKRINTDLRLVIAGDATHTENYLEEVKKLAKDDGRIIFTGALYGKEKKEAFSNARFFVLPSTIEGMPIVLLEAMSFGLCPLVSNIQENVDVIEKLGFSFKSRNVNDLKKKLEFMINNPEIIKKQGKLCKELVRKKYRWETVAKQTMQLYKNV